MLIKINGHNLKHESHKLYRKKTVRVITRVEVFVASPGPSIGQENPLTFRFSRPYLSSVFFLSRIKTALIQSLTLVGGREDMKDWFGNLNSFFLIIENNLAKSRLANAIRKIIVPKK